MRQNQSLRVLKLTIERWNPSIRIWNAWCRHIFNDNNNRRICKKWIHWKGRSDFWLNASSKCSLMECNDGRLCKRWVASSKCTHRNFFDKLQEANFHGVPHENSYTKKIIGHAWRFMHCRMNKQSPRIRKPSWY